MNLEPASCLAFEDSINGIRATRGANLKTIITVNDYTRDDDFSDAALVLDTFGEPDAPCHVLAGAAAALNGTAYLDVAALRRLHEDA
jgi:beta-phosphoglucomutase-like phosphatase (HAD superfamily)